MKSPKYNNLDINGLLYILEALKSGKLEILQSANEYTDKNIEGVTQTVDGIVRFVNVASGNGSRNLCCNFGYADFETVTAENVCYSKHSAITGLEIDADISYHGNKSLKITYDGSQLGSSTTPLYLGNEDNGYGCVKIEAGKKYILSCYVKADTDVPGFMIDFQGHNEPDATEDGLYLSTFDPRRLPGSSTLITLSKNWQRAICAFEVSSSSEDGYISPVPLIWGRPSSSVGEFNVWIDCIQFEEVENISDLPTEFTTKKEVIVDGESILAGTIATDKLKSDAIKSHNYEPGTAGSFLDLKDGSFDSKNLSWDSEGNLKAKNATIEGTVNATSGILKDCVFECGDDEIGLKIYVLNNEEYVIRSVATELCAWVSPSGIKVTSKGNFIYAGLTDEGLVEEGQPIKNTYAAKTHTHWKLTASDYNVGIGSSAGRLSTYDEDNNAQDNALNLGSSGARWKRVYAANATISTSDERMKKEISEQSEKYEQLFELLRPVTYRWIGEQHDRIHTGFIAQDVKKAMDEVRLDATEFAAFCYDNFKDDPEWTKENTDGMVDRYSLAYEEFISLNTHMIQKTRQEVKYLQTTLSEAVNTIKDLKQKIENLEKGESK